MSVEISVQINDQGPAAIRMRQRDRRGGELELEREDPYLTACESAAYGLLLDAGQRLPAGTIDVLVAEDEYRQLPATGTVGAAIARAA